MVDGGRGKHSAPLPVTLQPYPVSCPPENFPSITPLPLPVPPSSFPSVITLSAFSAVQPTISTFPTGPRFLAPRVQLSTVPDMTPSSVSTGPPALQANDTSQTPSRRRQGRPKKEVSAFPSTTSNSAIVPPVSLSIEEPACPAPFLQDENAKARITTAGGQATDSTIKSKVVLTAKAMASNLPAESGDGLLQHLVSEARRSNSTYIKSGKDGGNYQKAMTTFFTWLQTESDLSERRQCHPDAHRMGAAGPRGPGTADSFVSAAKWWFTHRGCESTWVIVDGVYQGNPAYAVIVTQTLKALKTLDKKSGRLIKHSLCFTYKDLELLTRFFKEDHVIHPTIKAYVLAACTVLFHLLLRIDEIWKLSMYDLKSHPILSAFSRHLQEMFLSPGHQRSSFGQNFGSQHRTTTLGGVTICVIMWITRPRMLSNLRAWLDIRTEYYEARNMVADLPSGFIFPRLTFLNLAATPVFNANEKMTPDSFMTTVNTLLGLCGVDLERERRTGHAFRRGGAQFYFLEKRPRWSFDKLMAWGAWETKDVIITYLIGAMKEIDGAFSSSGVDDRRIHGVMPGDEGWVAGSSTSLRGSDTSSFESRQDELREKLLERLTVLDEKLTTINVRLNGLDGRLEGPLLTIPFSSSLSRCNSSLLSSSSSICSVTLLSSSSTAYSSLPSSLHLLLSYLPSLPSCLSSLPSRLPSLPSSSPSLPSSSPSLPSPSPSLPSSSPSLPSSSPSLPSSSCQPSPTSPTPPEPALDDLEEREEHIPLAPINLPKFGTGKGENRDLYWQDGENYYVALYRCWYFGDPTSKGLTLPWRELDRMSKGKANGKANGIDSYSMRSQRRGIVQVMDQCGSIAAFEGMMLNYFERAQLDKNTVALKDLRFTECRTLVGLIKKDNAAFRDKKNIAAIMKKKIGVLRDFIEEEGKLLRREMLLKK
ncbi:hypothetical protein BC829DRAFT_450380 [Chytridium lagenaria]|nr:hypothetical protein BC829DRAFT_450380 [Chytridium lagenaria]